MATVIDIAQRRTEREAGHPSLPTLQSFAAGRLDTSRQLEVSSHLSSGCTRCRRFLRESVGLEQSSGARYRVQAPTELVDRLRALAEVAPAQLRLALDNLSDPDPTRKAAAVLDARRQIEDASTSIQLLMAGAEFLLEALESDMRRSDSNRGRESTPEEAHLLGQIAFELESVIGRSGSTQTTASIIERSWHLLGACEAHPLPRALLLSAYALVEGRSAPEAGTQWSRPPAANPLLALVEAQRLFALAPSPVEHAISTFALADHLLDPMGADRPDLLPNLSESLRQLELCLGECREPRMARVAAEYRLAVEMHAKRWPVALDLVQRLIRLLEDEADVTGALRLEIEAARIHRALGEERTAINKLRRAKDGMLINGYAVESAFAALELAELELEHGSSSSSLATDLLPIFAAIEDREAVAVLLMVREAALDSTVTAAQLSECRALLFELTST